MNSTIRAGPLALAHEPVPRHDRDAQHARQAAEGERDDAARREAVWQRRRRRGLAREVEQVGGAAGGVACGRDRRGRGGARGVVVGGDDEVALQVEGRFYECRGEA